MSTVSQHGPAIKCTETLINSCKNLFVFNSYRRILEEESVDFVEHSYNNQVVGVEEIQLLYSVTF